MSKLDTEAAHTQARTRESPAVRVWGLMGPNVCLTALGPTRPLSDCLENARLAAAAAGP